MNKIARLHRNVSVFLIHVNSFTQPRIRKDATRFKLSTALCEWQASREIYVQLIGANLSVEIKISLKRSCYLGQLIHSSDYFGWNKNEPFALLFLSIYIGHGKRL